MIRREKKALDFDDFKKWSIKHVNDNNGYGRGPAGTIKTHGSITTGCLSSPRYKKIRGDKE